MFPNDPDPIGDMQCIFAVKSNIPFLVESRKFPISFSEHLFYTDDEVGEYINVPAFLKKDYEYGIFIKKMQVSEIGSNMVFKISSQDYPEMETLRELIKIPSVAIDYKYIEGGYHKTMFTFHHSHMKEVTKFIFNARRSFGYGFPEYIGPNRGLRFVIEKAQTSGNIVASSLTINPPRNESEKMKELFSTNWVRRARYTSKSRTDDFIFRIQDPESINHQVFREISGEDRIYGANITSGIYLLYSKLVFEHYNPMFYSYHEYNGQNLRICGLIPENYGGTVVESVAETVKEFPDLDVKLTYSSRLKYDQNSLIQVFGPDFTT